MGLLDHSSNMRNTDKSCSAIVIMSFATILAVIVVSIVLMPVVSNSYNGGTEANAVQYRVITSMNNGSLVVEGADGADGVRGADGADGVRGADGADGAAGADGANGEILLEEIFGP
jgi:Collagen triple helix repeat (20 copies)